MTARKTEPTQKLTSNSFNRATTPGNSKPRKSESTIPTNKAEKTKRSNGSSKPAPVSDDHLLAEHASPSRQRIQLGYYHQTAQNICVAGTFNNWNPDSVPLQKKKDGYWIIDLNLEPGSYEYRFVVDGTWVEDPLASGFITNPFGDLNSVLKVPQKI